MSEQKTIRGVLEGLHYKAYEGSNSEEDVNQALSAISALINEAVGENKQGITYHKERKKHFSPTDYEKKGYNAAKAEIRQKLKEMGI
jgi:hypothetical protein